MLVTRKVDLLAAEEAPQLDITQRRRLRLSLGEGQVFVLAIDRGDDVPDVLRVFTLKEFSVIGSVFRWLITDDTGRLFEGRHKGIEISPITRVEAAPVFPLVLTQGEYGLKAAFEFDLPQACRIHLLHYLKRRWPQALRSDL